MWVGQGLTGAWARRGHGGTKQHLARGGAIPQKQPPGEVAAQLEGTARWLGPGRGTCQALRGAYLALSSAISSWARSL